MPEELNPVPADSRYRGWIVALPFILVALIAGYFWAEWKSRPSRPDEVTWDVSTHQMVRTERELTLYFPGVSEQWQTELRTIRGFDTERQEMRKCMEVFFEGPVRDKTATLPGLGRISVSGVYLDGRGMVVIDLLNKTDDVLNLGGIQSEYVLLQAIRQTLRANYPDVHSLRILVGGASQDTLAGHIDIRRPIQLL